MDLFAAPKLCRLLLLMLCVALLSSQTLLAWTHNDLQHASQRNHDWPNHGGPGLTNDRVAFRERKINPESVKGFRRKWEYITGTGGDVTATPAVEKGVVYFPAYNGNLYAVKASTGELVWEKNLTRLLVGTPIPEKAYLAQIYNLSIWSRCTPVVVGGLLVVGISSPGAVIAVKKSSGALVWSSLLDTHPYAIVTASGTAFEGAYYVGMSSLEETRTVGCCTFQGALYKLDLATGKILWKVLMMPDNGGKTGLYAGNAIWASSPPIDTTRRLIYAATGNAYSTPPAVTACRKKHPTNRTNPSFVDPCVAPDDYEDAVVAVHIDTGKVAWGKNLGGADVFVYACLLNPGSGNCPQSPGPDYDFGESPMLLTIHPENSSSSRDVVIVGQKSGFVWALDRISGALIWVTAAGPGGSLGGSSWGMTTDGKRVFTNILNDYRSEFKLLPSTKVVTRGGWVAMDAATGKILWSTANPDNFTAVSPLTSANGVVFGGSNGGAPATTDNGRVVAIDAESGDVLWTYPMPGPMAGGVAVVDGVAYVGSGTNAAFLALRQILGVPTDTARGKSVLAFSFLCCACALVACHKIAELGCNPGDIVTHSRIIS